MGFDLKVQVQSSMLAGGIAIGSVMTSPPWIGMTIGFCATLLSSLGFRYLKVEHTTRITVHNTANNHFLSYVTLFFIFKTALIISHLYFSI